MAIDTAERRKSVAGIHGPWTGTGVTPNSGKDQEWRQEAGYGYPGILAGGAAVIPSDDFTGLIANVGRLMR